MVRIIVLVFVSSFIFGCTWSNTVWLDKQPEKVLDTNAARKESITLLGAKPTVNPQAMVEARGTKDSATPALLLEEAILQAKKMKATGIYCPTTKITNKETYQNLALPPLFDPTAVKAAVDLATQFIGILKDIIALPFTLASSVKQSFTSEQTLGCFTYTGPMPASD